jgi:uncharacterized membrane-anchored protein
MAVLSLERVASRQLEEREGFVDLVRETVDSLRELIVDHVKLARLELQTDLQTYIRGIAVIAVAAIVLAIGYVFAWIAAGLGLARVIGAPLAFAAVAGLHLVLGALAVGWAAGRIRRTRPLHDSAVEAKSSVRALAHPLRERTS